VWPIGSAAFDAIVIEQAIGRVCFQSQIVIPGPFTDALVVRSGQARPRRKKKRGVARVLEVALASQHFVSRYEQSSLNLTGAAKKVASTAGRTEDSPYHELRFS